MKTENRDALVRFDDKNVKVHGVEDSFDWKHVSPGSLWYTRDDYLLFKRRDALIVSLVNGYRFYETKDHTYRGLERSNYDRYRQSLSRRVVLSEQDRQREAGMNDIHKISDMYRSICSYSAQQASEHGIQDALHAREETCCIAPLDGPPIFSELILKLHDPRTMRAHATGSMNPSMVSSMKAGERSRWPPYAPRSSRTVETDSKMEEYQPTFSHSHRKNLEFPQFIDPSTSNESISVDRATAISPIVSLRTGIPAHHPVPLQSLPIGLLAHKQPKLTKFISRNNSPKKSPEPISPCNDKSPHRRIKTIPTNLGMKISLLS